MNDKRFHPGFCFIISLDPIAYAYFDLGSVTIAPLLIPSNA